MRISRRRLSAARGRSRVVSPRSSWIACSSSFTYRSRPIAWMCPLCWPPEQVAGAAQLEVERRDAEAGAEVGELADRRQALARDLGEHGVGRHQQVGVGPAVGAADAAAQLVELGQAVAVGAVDEQRVGARDVEAVLDDRGGDQHVGAPLDEGEHHSLELGLRHLAVGDDDPGLGHQALDHARQRVDRLDAVVDEEDLAAARQLVADRRGDHVGRELDDRGLDREPVARRRLDHRHVADAGEAHLQRARDRRRRQRQHVDAAS